MKVVVAHNRYRSANPSGENRVVDAEIELLSQAGVQVIPLIEDSDELLTEAAAVGHAAVGPVIAPRGVRRMKEIIRVHEPDILHIHNVFPLISPWIIRVAKRAGIPIVQTVHNFRHTCVAGLHLRQGRVCEDCRLHSVPWPAVQHGCYRDSRGQSALMAFGQVVHRPTWRLVDRFLVTNLQMKETLLGEGIDGNRIEWRPTFAADHGRSDLPADGPVVFVGRLEKAKGLELLLDAWTPAVAAQWGKLVIAGDGPLRDVVRKRAERDESVEWRGLVSPAKVRALLAEGRLLAMPSLCFEGFPHAAADAMSAGRPLLVWEGMGLSTLSELGAAWAVRADARSWEAKLLALTERELRNASLASRRFYEDCCSPSASSAQLLQTYCVLARQGATQ